MLEASRDLCIGTTGKGHLDLMEALRPVGLDEAACRRLGDRYLQGPGWSGPLARTGCAGICVRQPKKVLVIEEKPRHQSKASLRNIFNDWPGQPSPSPGRKHRAAAIRCCPGPGELSPLDMCRSSGRHGLMRSFFRDEICAKGACAD